MSTSSNNKSSEIQDDKQRRKRERDSHSLPSLLILHHTPARQHCERNALLKTLEGLHVVSFTCLEHVHACRAESTGRWGLTISGERATVEWKEVKKHEEDEKQKGAMESRRSKGTRRRTTKGAQLVSHLPKSCSCWPRSQP